MMELKDDDLVELAQAVRHSDTFENLEMNHKKNIYIFFWYAWEKKKVLQCIKF